MIIWHILIVNSFQVSFVLWVCLYPAVSSVNCVLPCVPWKYRHPVSTKAFSSMLGGKKKTYFLLCCALHCKAHQRRKYVFFPPSIGEKVLVENCVNSQQYISQLTNSPSQSLSNWNLQKCLWMRWTLFTKLTWNEFIIKMCQRNSSWSSMNICGKIAVKNGTAKDDLIQARFNC